MSQSQQRYRVIEKLEAGGMAEVFRAESEGLQGFKKQVAIKRVLPHLSEKKKFISMFLDEARLCAQLTHSNCVQVFDIGVGDNAYFIVMEFVDGANLKSVVENLKKQGRDIPLEVSAFLAAEICKGLDYAHNLKDSSGVDLHIVHRDMSPPNVLITKFGEVKIVDFGLAKASSQLEKSEPGIIKGKFSYLSPEAALGQDVDPRTDVFAVGIILWELLTGKRLFLGDTDFQTVKQVQEAKVPSVRSHNPQVPLELEQIVNRSLARDPKERYQTARELAQDLTRFLFQYGKPVSSFDLAQIVEGVMRGRVHKKPLQRGSIIDQLIEEALFEFTSLKTDDEAAPSTEARAGTPLDPGQFVDTTNWAEEIGGLGLRDTGSRASLANLPEVGGLSSLEDDDEYSAQKRSLAPALGAPESSPISSHAPAPLVGRGASTRSAETALAAAPAPSAPKSNTGLLIGVLLLMAVGAAGAWFGGLIPH